jgi:hypothetical protein
MKRLPILMSIIALAAPSIACQTNPQSERAGETAAKALKRANLRRTSNSPRRCQARSKLMGSVMERTPNATKFWPIYRDYDAELKRSTTCVFNLMEYKQLHPDDRPEGQQ